MSFLAYAILAVVGLVAVGVIVGEVALFVSCLRDKEWGFAYVVGLLFLISVLIGLIIYAGSTGQL